MFRKLIDLGCNYTAEIADWSDVQGGWARKESSESVFEATIYFDKSQKYSGDSIGDILSEFSSINSDQIRTRQIERTDIRSEDLVVEDIRMIKPQSRGSVVASGGSALPISGSKKLNLRNTPVILVREKKRPVYVFPCKIGERYYSVRNGISFLRENLPNRVELQGEMEDTLVRIILDDPEKIEVGLVLDDYEQETPTGKTDVVFKDSKGKFVVMEVEREATDAAVGQILRLSAGFEKHQDFALNAVRAGIACYRIAPNVLAACTRAGIEVWRYEPKIERFRRATL